MYFSTPIYFPTHFSYKRASDAHFSHKLKKKSRISLDCIGEGEEIAITESDPDAMRYKVNYEVKLQPDVILVGFFAEVNT